MGSRGTPRTLRCYLRLESAGKYAGPCTRHLPGRHSD
jgi:hypothetical protein